MSSTVDIYTDGACSGNPGCGGWGAVLVYKNGNVKEICGGSDYTTNNKMELQAVIEGLRVVDVNSDISVYTDSIYVQRGMTEWIANWKMNGWRTAKKKEVKNRKFWQELDSYINLHKGYVKWIWVKGHAGNPYNELADKLARGYTVP